MNEVSNSQKDEFLLSFCIPTYNRAGMLGALLDVLSQAVPQCGHSIEILVSDNASTDDTSAVVESFKTKLPMLKYLRNSINIGSEGNQAKLVDASRGEYLWIFGDDDLIDPRHFHDVIEKISSDPDYMVMNFSVFNRDFSICKTEAVYNCGENRVINDKNDLMKLFGLRLGLTSGIIFKSDAYKKINREEYMRHAESGLSSLYAAFTVGHSASKGYYFSTPVVRYRGDNSDHSPTAARWTDVYGRCLSMLIKDMAQLGYKATARHKFNTDVVRKYYLFCMLGERLKRGDVKSYYKSLFLYYWHVPEAWFLIATAIIPDGCVHLVRKLWRGYTHKNVDLQNQESS